VNAAPVAGWLKNDANAVLETLRPDAMPIPQGRPPIKGFIAIDEFWWPAGGPRTTITSFAFMTDEIGGSGGAAYARGTYQFDFSYETNGRASTRHNSGNYLMVFRPCP
jgi:ketosteroid isomerase-like protein